MATRGTKPKGKVCLLWNQKFAYAIGLIVADGSLSKDGLHIDFSSKDYDLVEVYLECLGVSDITIGRKYSGISKTKIYYRAQLGDVLFYRFLEDIGLMPNKSKVIKAIKVEEKYFFDFLRGVWDGDGTIYTSKDLRWKNSIAVNLGIASGSIVFLQWIQSEINSRLGTTGFISQAKDAFQLRYARMDSKRIFKSMFYEGNLPHLQRKFAKAQKIFTMAML